MSDTRKYGDGSVYQLKNGTWKGKYFPRKGDKPKYFSGKTEREVRRKINEYRRSPEALVIANAKNVNVADYFRNWLLTFKRNSLKPKSYDRIESIIEGTISQKLGTLRMGDITGQDCQRVINDLMANGRAYRTVKKVYDTMNNCFKHAVKAKDISDNPMIAVEMPAQSTFERKREIRALNDDEVKKLLSELERRYISSGNSAYQYKDVFIVVLHTGMRLGEVVALDWDDVDWDAKTIHIHKDAIIIKERDKDGKGLGTQKQIIQESPKTDKSNRTITLNKTAYAAMQRLKATSGNCPYVVHTDMMNRTYCNTLYRQLKRAYDRCGIKDTDFHTLRHTFATRLFSKGATVKDVSTLLGHSSITITANTYIHVIDQRKTDMVHLLDEIEGQAEDDGSVKE